MITHLKLFIRDLNRNRTLSAINILGLVLGMLSTLFILEYVAYERSYDSHHENADNVYRIAYNRYKSGELMWETSYSFAPMPYYLNDNFDEVVNSFQMRRNYNANFTLTDGTNNLVSFNEAKTYFTTGSIFDVLSIPLIRGEKNCLDEPNTLAISQRLAEKYFGVENPIGKQIKLNHNVLYTITAVFETFPHNTHFRTDVLLTLRNFIDNNKNILTNWQREGFYNYIQLKPGTNPDLFLAKAFPIMKKEHVDTYLNARSLDDRYYLQRFSDIHLTSNIENEMEIPSSKRAINVLFVFSVFFIIIAWVNYINLISARAIERAKEVGIKKIVGSTKTRLVIQFLGETLWFNLFTLVITFALFLLLNPAFKNLTKIDDFNFLTFHNYGWYFLLFLLVGIALSGFYSSFILTAIKPVQIIKGKFIKTHSGMLFRKGLVTFQFAVSLILFVGTIVSYVQFTHLMQQDIGINYNSKLAISSPRPNGDITEHYKKLEILKQKIKQIPVVRDACIVSDLMGHEVVNYFGGRKLGTDQTHNTEHFRINADNNFIDFFKIRVIAGESYKESDLPESNKIMLTESSMKRFEFNSPEEAVGATIIDFRDNRYTIIGVTEDFQYKSVKVEAVPLVISNFNQAKNYLVLNLTNSNNFNNEPLINQCNAAYSQVFGTDPFECQFLEDNIANDLKPDRTFVQVFSLFSIQAIIIAALGVLGLLIITINQTMKQIGVRKVMGAQRANIFKILTFNLVPQFGLAIIIGIPFSYYIIERFILSQYISRISLQWYYFGIPVILLSLLFSSIAMLQATRANKANVVDVIREEA